MLWFVGNGDDDDLDVRGYDIDDDEEVGDCESMLVGDTKCLSAGELLFSALSDGLSYNSLQCFALFVFFCANSAALYVYSCMFRFLFLLFALDRYLFFAFFLTDLYIFFWELSLHSLWQIVQSMCIRNFKITHKYVSKHVQMISVVQSNILKNVFVLYVQLCNV